MTDVSIELHQSIEGGMDSFTSDGPGGAAGGGPAFQMESVSSCALACRLASHHGLRYLSRSSQGPVDRTEMMPQGAHADVDETLTAPLPSSSPGGQPSPHVRRKSALPLDPQVIRDLQAHRSLEDGAQLGPPVSVSGVTASQQQDHPSYEGQQEQ